MHLSPSNFRSRPATNRHYSRANNYCSAARPAEMAIRFIEAIPLTIEGNDTSNWIRRRSSKEKEREREKERGWQLGRKRKGSVCEQERKRKREGEGEDNAKINCERRLPLSYIACSLGHFPIDFGAAKRQRRRRREFGLSWSGSANQVSWKRCQSSRSLFGPSLGPLWPV